MKKLNILLVDDKVANLEAASKLFSEHKITLMSFFDLAQNQDLSQYDMVLIDLFMPYEANPDQIASIASREVAAAKNVSFVQDGDLIPSGFVLVMKALAQKVPMIGLCTDAGHHKHPLTWALDSGYYTFGEYASSKSVVSIGESRFVVSMATKYTSKPKINGWAMAFNSLVSSLVDISKIE